MLLAATLIGAHAQAADAIVSGRFLSEGAKRTYAAYAPPGETPRPLVIVLHGSGGSGREMVRRWKDLAKREGFVVAGPDAFDPNSWQPPRDGPALLRDLVQELQPHRIDRRRIYLFGYSAGAVFALYMAPLEAEYFAAAASYAGAYQGEADLGFLETSVRKIPLLLSVGEKDALFPTAVVLATAKRLEQAGFPVTTSILPGERHSYQSSREINERAWSFLQQHRLAADPVFVPVRF